MAISEESKELKLLYIQEELSQHGEWLCDELRDAIELKGLKDTDVLVDSIDYSHFMDGDNPGLRVKFCGYGRAFEIAGYQKKKQNKWAVNTNRIVWKIKERKVKKAQKKKDTRWYAKNMYGGQNRLIGRIMYGLSDIEIERLKGILDNRKNNSL